MGTKFQKFLGNTSLILILSNFLGNFSLISAVIATHFFPLISLDKDLNLIAGYHSSEFLCVTKVVHILRTDDRKSTHDQMKDTYRTMFAPSLILNFFPFLHVAQISPKTV